MRSSYFFKRLLQDDRGGTAIEYGLIVSLVVLAMIGALKGVADENTRLWSFVTSSVTAVMQG